MTSKKIVVNSVHAPKGGIIGMSQCPGRRGAACDGRHWKRDLQTDLSDLQDWGAQAVVTLLEADEIVALGVAGLEQSVKALNLRWYHWPVQDMHPPGPAFFAAYRQSIDAIDEQLRRGDRIVLHCAAGLGRTGTVAASLLIRGGLDPETAISQVRNARPGTIETAIQERFVRQADILCDGSAGGGQLQELS